MAAAWLTDNRHLDRMRYDHDLVARTGLDADEAASTAPDRVDHRPGARRRRRHDRAGPRNARDRRYPRSALGRGRRRRRARLRHAPRDQQHVVDQLPGAVQANRRPPPDRLGPGDHSRPVPRRRTTTRPADSASQWLRDQVLVGDDAATEPDLDDLTALAATAAPGAGDVLFTPWLAGERSPVDDHNARGGFHNLSLSTSRADLVRAVLEGVALQQPLVARSRRTLRPARLDPIRFIGGGAQSDLWCQIHADVMDRTVERVARTGARQPAGRGVDRRASPSASCAPSSSGRSSSVDSTFVPDPRPRATYDRLFAEFPKLYRSQRAMFRRLNRPRPGS